MATGLWQGWFQKLPASEIQPLMLLSRQPRDSLEGNLARMPYFVSCLMQEALFVSEL